MYQAWEGKIIKFQRTGGGTLALPVRWNLMILPSHAWYMAPPDAVPWLRSNYFYSILCRFAPARPYGRGHTGQRKSIAKDEDLYRRV